MLKKYLSESNITYKLRPHPMSYKKNEITKEEIAKFKMEIDDTILLNLSNYKFLIYELVYSSSIFWL